jgi:hypothetical protein
MEIPIGRLRLIISVNRVPGQQPRWEHLASAGRDDHELARLNRRNTDDYDGAPWRVLRLIERGGLRP